VSQVQLKNEFEDSELKPLLKVKDLSVTFTQSKGVFRRKVTEIHAVNNVSFEIRQSQVLSLVGESGSGKTTIARCIAALARPNSGSIEYKGAEVTKLKGQKVLDYRKDVQIIFQDPYESLNPRQTVYDSIAGPMRRLGGEKNDRTRLLELVTNVLREVGLHPSYCMQRYPHQLSGGERQRVNIARALAPNPKLLLADEPITMLDASQRLSILSLLAALGKKRNLTILLITHDLASAKIMSDRTAVMYLGNLVEEGPTSIILSKPRHPYTELILEATPRLKEWNQELTKYLKAPIMEKAKVPKNGCVFAPRCKYVTEKCLQVIPPFEEKSPSHLAACHNILNA
jgi:peptide/nickel transport system ATP-binding protein